MDGTFATHLASVDSALFVGRVAELAAAREFLGLDTSRRLLWVCGEGGIDKSALLREVGRIALSMGYTVHRLDGRQIGQNSAQLAAALEVVWSDVKPLLVIDGFDHMLPLGPHLRSDAHELVRRLEVDDDQSAQNLVRWAAGLPLALTAGAWPQ